MRTYNFPIGQIVNSDGTPTVPGKAYLDGIHKLTDAFNELTNLDSGTSYTADQLRDKIIAIIDAMQGE